MKWLFITFILCMSLILYGVYRFDQYEQQLVEARGDAAFEREIQQKLLSKGRWVRTYDPGSNTSTYRYARSKEQR